MNLTKELDYKKLERKYVKSNIKWDSFDDIENYYKEIVNREINDTTQFNQLILDYSELQYVFCEREGILYKNMTSFTNDNKKQEEYQNHINHLKPKAEEYGDSINRKIITLNKKYPLSNDFSLYLKRIQNYIRLFELKNIELQKEDDNLYNEYTKIQGNLIFNFQNKKHTVQQMYKYLESTDRELRKEAYETIWAEKFKVKDSISDIFMKQINVRNQKAKNLDFSSYVQYKFLELERFDYTPEDCFQFHNSIKKLILPLTKKFAELRKSKLNISTLRPYDFSVDIYGSNELKPFTNVNELLEKTFLVFDKINPLFANILKLMNEKSLLDLETREGKAPGGYMMTLPETKIPFIFMNASGVHSDLITLMHEAGHAFNHYLGRNEKIFEYTWASAEIGEVASMAMELITMEYWDVFYTDRIDFIRAQLRHLEWIIGGFPWTVAIDSLQHWIYTQKEINTDKLISRWNIINEELAPYIDYSNYENYKSLLWQSQLHIFGYPFYYIEYAIAQIGAFNVWINYKKDKTETINKYIEGFSLGGRKTMPELYKSIGITFDFSENNLNNLVENIQIEIECLTRELSQLENKQS